MTAPRLDDQPRVILVHPPAREGVRSLFTFHKNQGLGIKPPLAILTLATHLRAQGYNRVTCLDTQLGDLTPQQTVEAVAAERPDVVGLTVWTDFWYPAWRTVELIRQRLPRCLIVLGGPHCAIYPAQTLAASRADFLIAGEGEEVLLELLNRLQAGEEPLDLDGLWRKEGGRIVEPKEKLALVRNLDLIPAPDRSLLPIERYTSVLTPRRYETTMITSRGCPHRCVFCKMVSQKVHARSAKSVVEEFRTVAGMGIRDVQIYDDTFTWSKDRVMEICRGLLDLKLGVRWAVRDRVGRADAEMYSLMRRAGCRRIHFGVESGSPRILAQSGKGITLQEVRRAVGLAREAGLDTMAYYMFGFLDETLEEAWETIRFARELRTDYAVFAVLIPYPGTEIYRAALEEGIIPFDHWLEFTRNPRPDYRIPHLIEQHLNRRALIDLRDRALRTYYLRPGRIFKEVKGLRSFRDLAQKSRMALNILQDQVVRRPCR